MKKVTEFAISRKGKLGLSSAENKEVLKALREWKDDGLIPSLTYKYNAHPGIFGKDSIYAKPKTGSVSRTAVIVRRLIRRTFSSKYTVYLV